MTCSNLAKFLIQGCNTNIFEPNSLIILSTFEIIVALVNAISHPRIVAHGSYIHVCDTTVNASKIPSVSAAEARKCTVLRLPILGTTNIPSMPKHIVDKVNVDHLMHLIDDRWLSKTLRILFEKTVLNLSGPCILPKWFDLRGFLGLSKLTPSIRYNLVGLRRLYDSDIAVALNWSFSLNHHQLDKLYKMIERKISTMKPGTQDYAHGIEEPQMPGNNYIKLWIALTNELFAFYSKKKSFNDMMKMTEKMLKSKIPDSVVVDCVITKILNNYSHWINFNEFIIEAESGNEYTPSIDSANSLQVYNTRPLSRKWINQSIDIDASGDEFIERAMARIPVTTTYLRDLERLHEMQLKEMNLKCLTAIELSDWSPQGWLPREMQYEYVGTIQPGINTMDFDDGSFVAPDPIEGQIPEVKVMKTRQIYPDVFKYGKENNRVALNMWFYLLNEEEQTFVRQQGLTNIVYLSHEHGVAVGKAFTEFLRRNLLR